jgi:hypothetical protein
VELPDLDVDGRGAKTTATKKDSSALAPPTSTVKVVKAAKGRVRVEKGFSQLDWAKLNRSGEVDLRVRFTVYLLPSSKRLPCVVSTSLSPCADSWRVKFRRADLLRRPGWSD